MLQSTHPKARECYERAARARDRAAHARDELERQDCLNDEARWLKLAQSYEYTARLTDFLNKQRRSSHPKCATCAVPMWHIGTQHLSGDPPKDRWHYECKVCGEKLVLPPVSQD
jgi:hypothetical protein